MYMLSTLDILFKEVERAKRLEAYPEEPRMPVQWRSYNSGKTREEWEKMFAREALTAYPSMREYCDSVESKNYLLQEEVYDLKRRILELEDRNKK